MQGAKAIHVMKTCVECAAQFTSGRPNKRFCSESCRLRANRKIAKPDNQRQRASICARCNMPFVITGSWYTRHHTKYCGTECQAVEERRKVDVLLGEGKPLINVFEDHVQCNLCGMTMSQAGTHFRRVHLLGVHKSMTHSERQHIYGLTQGARLASGKLMQKYRQNGIEKGFPSEYAVRHMRGDTTKCPPHIPQAPKSARQLASCERMVFEGKGARSKHEAAATELVCKGCGCSYTVTAHRARTRKYCSLECSKKFMPGPTMTPEGIERIRQAVSLSRRRPTERICLQCKAHYVSSPNLRIHFCGRVCQGHWQKGKPRGSVPQFPDHSGLCAQ